MSNDSWIEQAYPLQQVSIQLQGTRHSDKVAVINQLETVIARLNAGDTSGKSHDDDFGYSFTYVKDSPGPSFFDEPAGQTCSPAEQVEPEFEPEFEVRHVPRTIIGLVHHLLSIASLGAVFFGVVAYIIAGVLITYKGSSIDLYGTTVHYAIVGFFIVGMFAWFDDAGIVVRERKEERQ